MNEVFLLILLFLVILLLLSLVLNNRKQINDYVPLDVWQTYVNNDIPGEAERCRQTWVNQKNTRYHFMSDKDIDKYIKNNFDIKIYNVFNELPLGVMKADMWRYCILYKRGGIYSDIDSKMLIPVKDWKFIKNNKIIIGLEDDIHFCQWTIISSAGHPILKNVIDMIVMEFKKGIDLQNEHFVHKHTGPGIWTKAINKTLGFKQTETAIEVWNKYKSGKYKNKFEILGLKLVPKDYFRNTFVQNLFGSRQFNDGYKSWIKERDQLLGK